MTPSRRRICRPLIRRIFNSFAASTTMKSGASRQAIVKMVGRMLQKEVASLCSNKSESVLGKKPSNEMGNFFDLINAIIKELQFRAPTLLSLLKWALKTRRARQNCNVIMAMIISIICKNRRSSVSLFQNNFINSIHRSFWRTSMLILLFILLIKIIFNNGYISIFKNWGSACLTIEL